MVNLIIYYPKSATQNEKIFLGEISNCHIFIAAAAVTDFAPKIFSPQKIKRNHLPNGQYLNIELENNPDILFEVANLSRRPSLVVGFAAETENLLTNAYQKMQSKKLDMIIANQVGENLTFDNDNNLITILALGAKPLELGPAPKIELAGEIMKILRTKLL